MKKILHLVVLFFLSITLFTPAAYAQEKEQGASATLTTLSSLQVTDKRVEILRAFLQKRNSPLVEQAAAFVEEADNNKLDWKLVAAISGIESTFGQQVPYNCNNAWGWGIYGDTMTCFPTYKEAIKTISKGLRSNYINRWNAKNIHEIGRIYAASPTWSQRVSYFMNQIDTFAFEYDTKNLAISL